MSQTVCFIKSQQLMHNVHENVWLCVARRENTRSGSESKLALKYITRTETLSPPVQLSNQEMGSQLQMRHMLMTSYHSLENAIKLTAAWRTTSCTTQSLHAKCCLTCAHNVLWTYFMSIVMRLKEINDKWQHPKVDVKQPQITGNTISCRNILILERAAPVYHLSFTLHWNDSSIAWTCLLSALSYISVSTEDEMLHKTWIKRCDY